jgi:hypothetical protein
VLVKRITALRTFSLLSLAVACSLAVADIGSRANPTAQAAADVVRAAAAADCAFLAAGLLHEPRGEDMGSLLQFSEEGVVVVTLTGTELRQALERSLSNYPNSSGAFLQLSGLTVTFSESAAPESRILEVRVGEATLSASRQYTVAMPATLARGALGYFRIWDRTKISREIGKTLDELLKGKTGAARTSRYIAKP